MKKILLAGLLVAASSVLLGGCTDAERAAMFAYGDKAQITCYSGGEVVFQDTSTGKVSPVDGEGLTFKSNTTGAYVRAFADCIVTNEAPR